MTSSIVFNRTHRRHGKAACGTGGDHPPQHPDDWQYRPRVRCSCRETPDPDFAPVLAQTAAVLMAQGRKEVRLADEFLQLRSAELLVVSVSMPLSGRVLRVA